MYRETTRGRVALCPSLTMGGFKSSGGVGYLVRQAIRNGWTLKDPSLAEAWSILRPYNQANPMKILNRCLRECVTKYNGRRAHAISDDIEEDLTENGIQPPRRTMQCETFYNRASTYCVGGDKKWRILKERILDLAGNEKVVLFVQPIETVIPFP